MGMLPAMTLCRCQLLNEAILSAPISHMKRWRGHRFRRVRSVFAVSAERNSASGAITLTCRRFLVMRRAPLSRAGSDAIPHTVFSGFCGLTSHHISSRRSALLRQVRQVEMPFMRGIEGSAKQANPKAAPVMEGPRCQMAPVRASVRT